MESSYVGEVAKLGKLYSRFRPQRKEPEFQVAQRHPAGDIPGSRTHPSTSAAAQASGDASDAVMETVTIDAQDLFSQLTTLAYLAKREVSKGLLLSIQEVSEGTIRVWRDWLAKHCESKQWTDGDTVPIHREAAQTEVSGKGKARADSVAAFPDLRKEPNALWVNTRGSDLVGIKFRVAERKWRQANPVLFSNDIEVAVSYEVEFQGKLARPERHSCSMLTRLQRSTYEPCTCSLSSRRQSSNWLTTRGKPLSLAHTQGCRSSIRPGIRGVDVCRDVASSSAPTI